MLGLFLYSCWRRHKGLKEGVYHVSAHHGEWEDIRENVLNYDEEGGGEQDQVSASSLGATKKTSPQMWECLSITRVDGNSPFLCLHRGANSRSH